MQVTTNIIKKAFKSILDMGDIDIIKLINKLFSNNIHITPYVEEDKNLVQF